jgi:hypothetical protein
VRTAKTPEPGRSGTREFLRRFGPSLACGCRQIQLAAGRWLPDEQVWLLGRNRAENLGGAVRRLPIPIR